MGADLYIPGRFLHQAAQMAKDMSQTHSQYNFSFTTVTVSPNYVLGFFIFFKQEINPSYFEYVVKETLLLWFFWRCEDLVQRQ